MAVAVDETTADLKPLSPPSDAQIVPGSQAPPAADLDAKTNGNTTDASAIPKVNVNGEPVSSPRPSASFGRVDAEDARWGSNFWVTLVDPQTSTVFFACPATGQVSWDPPAGTFVLPPSTEGEWWELSDDSRGGIPYYYQTKTGETVWERPDSFVIPLTVIQVIHSRIYYSARSASLSNSDSITGKHKRCAPCVTPFQRRAPVAPTLIIIHADSHHGWSNGHHLPPIPASPYTTEPSTPSSRKSLSTPPAKVAASGSTRSSRHKEKDRRPVSDIDDTSPSRSRAKSSSYVPHRSPIPQSLNAAVEMLSLSERRAASDTEATKNMSAVKNPTGGKPIPIARQPTHSAPTTTLASGTYPVLPHDLASDIQQFVESDYARQYFSTHRTGFIFRRKVPVAQMMTWQKAPLSSPLLTLNRSLKNDAVRIFKVIQHIMGDREREKSAGIPVHNGSVHSLTGSTVGLLEEERWLLGEGLAHGELRDEIYCQLMKQLNGNPNTESVFKGWQMLCVLLTAFPPSKNFETYLRSFMQQRTTQQEGRVDVIAKHCLRRLVAISKKGPRGKPPTMAEIETASDAAFNPSTFGESLDATMRLQERNYPHEKIPIILPFLADGILALGGMKAEGIFRVAGDSDSVSELKLRIDRGYYTLDSVDDPHVLASLLKLWLRELSDPLVPEEMYNDCITHSREPEMCIQLVRRLPTINRRVVIFLISFLQFFLEEKVQTATKMTSANLALVMAPNLLRCNSESMTVVFTNAQYEQVFVYNLLMHLKCDQIDADYVPVHGLGASLPSPPQPRVSKSRNRK
ncbi:uncharacterized protein BJ212DRAFT_1569642 [Suillus subaureus]|uniref:Rho GTPase activation protein n=1 Tax=Suillus subaureus TaxID=48587 RepID=A0A9P7E6Y3_9AGAM|nr:uncharacterized protein BJ212DRAFT_1569642 [Suillus subaureus]KAG1812552.1 hypothetical protein BJ212DRAFT_1569642 [Suillus subaureus]